MGYLSLSAVTISVPAALWLLVSSLMGMVCAATSVVVGNWCLYCVVRAIQTAREKYFISHRRYAIRMWAVCFGVFTMRIMIGTLKKVFYPVDEKTAVSLFSIEFVVGWFVSCGFGEAYMKWTSSGSNKVSQEKKII